MVDTAKYTDVMLDLETLGTAPGSVILSIGAVAFAEGLPESEWKTLEVKPISVSNSRLYELTIDESTLAWWLHQSAEARKVLDQALEPVKPGGCYQLEFALGEFAIWFPEGARVWGNGANFDNVLLRGAYDAISLKPPWQFFDDRCFRTMKNLFKCVSAPDFQGVKHDALADALHQTRWLIKILRHIKALEECFELNGEDMPLAEALGLCEDQHPETVNADPEEL